MVPLAAEIITENVIGDERAAVRRSLRLGIQAHSSGDVAMALILNISETGLLIESVVHFAVGETLQIDFPEASISTARVVWTEGLLAGCEFVKLLSGGTLSALQLQSPIEETNSANDAPEPDTDVSNEEDRWGPNETFIETAIIVIIYIIALLAICISITAIFPIL